MNAGGLINTFTSGSELVVSLIFMAALSIKPDGRTDVVEQLHCQIP